jgi:alkylation response protein AidB-like acyl-CoA dehydrogenase
VASEIVALEEVGVLGNALGCALLHAFDRGRSVVPFRHRRTETVLFGSHLGGEMVAAEALTEPRGGSDFFDVTTCAELEDGSFAIRGQKRFVVAARGAYFFAALPRSPRTEIVLLSALRTRPGFFRRRMPRQWTQH